MTVKTNALKVRRIDLLEQLEERFAVMTKEKDKYDKIYAAYLVACDKYDKEMEEWESRIPAYLEGMVRGSEVTIIHRTENYRYRSEERWEASIDVSLTRAELEKKLGSVPERPESPERPKFLQEKWGYRYNSPSLYQSVYQAIQLLHMSDDEHVNASMYQLALEVL
jgi:hypothetical protein